MGFYVRMEIKNVNLPQEGLGLFTAHWLQQINTG